jgi:hypothetical protein
MQIFNPPVAQWTAKSMMLKTNIASTYPIVVAISSIIARWIIYHVFKFSTHKFFTNLRQSKKKSQVENRVSGTEDKIEEVDQTVKEQEKILQNHE